MKYKHIFLLALTIPALVSLQTKAQGQPPTTPGGRPSAPGTSPTAPEIGPAAPSVTPAAPNPTPSPAVSAPDPNRITRGAAVSTFSRNPMNPNDLVSFAHQEAPLEIVMEQYCEWTDQIFLKTDPVKASITVKAEQIPVSEAIKVVEAILAMNNVALVPMGEKYLKVVMATAPDMTGQGLDPIYGDQAFGSTDKFVTTVVQLDNVSFPEVQAAIQHVLHAYGKILSLERSNSIMLTDTEANVKRATELIQFIDQATAQIEPKIYKIEYAEATEIAAKLNEIVVAAQGNQPQATATRTRTRTPPGVIRPGSTRNSTAARTPTQATVSSTQGSNAVIIQGDVKIMADERTNIIIIFSLESNFEFFDNIISVLDVEVEPATTFEVVNLEYADATDLSGTLNDLIGAASSSRSGTSSSRTSASSSRTGGTTSRTSSSRNTSSSRSSRVTPNALPTDGKASIENLNRLSEDTKILADERSNSILLMGRRSDIAALKEVIATLDIMLEQVSIEAAIFEVTLGDELRHGIDWLYRSDSGDKVGAWDGNNLIGSTNGLGTVAAGALTYYQNITGINTEIAINLAASDSNVRLLSTPVIMTTDNTEARLAVGEQRPVVTSTSNYANSSGTQSSNYEYKDIGINLTVTPRINPQRVVVMEILQQADQVGGEIEIDGNQVPIILNREFEAQISVPDRGTIALGGLVNTETRDSVTKIPILGDIPFIGRYLFSSTSEENRQTELVVLMTPYVMTTNDEAIEETERLYDATDMQPTDWPNRGWSGSPLQKREKEVPEDAVFY